MVQSTRLANGHNRPDPWKLIWGVLQRTLKHTDLMAQSQVFQLEVNS
jgi:hypothetical protein